MWLHDQLRSWHEKEEEDSRTQNRRPRFKLWELSSPPLALAWLNSHQDLKFPGEPPTPNLFTTSANTAADEVAGTQELDDAGPHSGLEPPVLWPAGLPRFWISFDRRAPLGAASKAVQRHLLARTRATWASLTDRPWQGALGRLLDRIYPGTLPLQLFAQVVMPAGARVPRPTDTRRPPNGGNPLPIPATREPTPEPAPAHRSLNLEAFACRLRMYVGGSYTQSLHVRPHLQDAVTRNRADAAVRASSPPLPADLIEALAAADYDETKVDPAVLAEADRDTLAALRPTAPERIRACPFEAGHPGLGPGAPPAAWAPWAGTLRHLALLCTHPDLVAIREAMFDAVEHQVAEATRNPDVQMRHRPGNAPMDNRESSTGATPAARWPNLWAAKWLLPLEQGTEARLTTGDEPESAWDVGYRGLVPRALARSLVPRPEPALDDHHNPPEERALVRSLERARRRALSVRILPGCTDAGGPEVDLFGDPLTSSDEECSVDPAAASRAARVQAVCLPIVHTIVGHMAWLRAKNHALLLARFESQWEAPLPPPSDNAPTSGADVSDANPSGPRCTGAGCLERERAGLPRNPVAGRRGTAAFRCLECGAEERLDQCEADLRALLSRIPVARARLRPTRPAHGPPQPPPHARRS